MALLALTWEWPTTFIYIVATIAIGVAAHLVVSTLIRRSTARMRRMAAEPEGTLAFRAAAAIGRSTGAKPGRTVVHTTAIARLLRSVWSFTLVIIVLLLILSYLGVPLSPFLASAGIGGVVLAFGAQSLIKDYLSGIAMIVEDQYGVGDQINVGEVTGTVEDISLRITKLRDVQGMIWYVRNGEILRVGNVSQGYSTGLIDVPVAYDADLTLVTEVLNSVVTEVSEDNDITELLLEPPRLLGVESITPTTVTMRILIKTPANKHFALVRDIRERAMAALSAAGVQGPAVLPYSPYSPG
ncbi:MAG: mechanosensitive ion channel family protein [Propionibacteriaceae bacterium]|jgi:small conductance mechanosensitive channel|nr:mechanosensitive ion channel family protein [Propionibacteriaceae bacterium]